MFGSARDPQMALVSATAIALGHEVVSVSPEGWCGDGREPHAVSITRGSPPTVRFGFKELMNIDAAWIRHLPSPFSPAPLRPQAPAGATNGSDGAEERTIAFFGAIDALNAVGIPVVNPPAPGIGLNNRPAQLIRLAKAGIPIPETLVTDDPAAALAFAAGRQVVCKPVTSSGTARVLDKAGLAALPTIVRAPVILQELAHGADIRATVIDGQIVSAVAIESPAGAVDQRAAHGYARAGTRYRSLELSPAIAATAIETVRILGLRFAEVELRVPPKRPEAYRIVEVNPSPTFLDIELKTGHRISEALVHALTASARDRQEAA